MEVLRSQTGDNDTTLRLAATESHCHPPLRAGGTTGGDGLTKIRSQGHPTGARIMVEAALGTEDHKGGPAQKELQSERG